MKYKTKEGDVLDAICTSYYGEQGFDLDLIYRANPGLGDLGPVYPSGVLINLPEAQTVNPVAKTVKLWD